MDVCYEPATADRFDDLTRLLAPRDPDGPACWCMYYRLASGPFGRLPGPERREEMRRLCSRPVAPGVLAYVSDEVAGWCHVGLRSEMARLVRSRTIPVVDDAPVWSVVCFVVRAGYRRQGLATGLLRAAVRHAASAGATIIEGYPVDNAGRRVDLALAYVGTLSMFESVGFRKVAATSGRSGGAPRVVVRLAVPSAVLSE